MPIYEYHCNQCENDFEVICSWNDLVSCPECSSEKVSKLPSLFAGKKSGKDCHSCSGKDCSSCH